MELMLGGMRELEREAKAQQRALQAAHAPAVHAPEAQGARHASHQARKGDPDAAERETSRASPPAAVSVPDDEDDEMLEEDESSDEDEVHVRALRLMGAKNLKPARSRLSKTLEHRGWAADEKQVPGIAGLVERVDIGKLRRLHKVGARLAGKQATGLRDLVTTDADVEADDEFFYYDDKGNMVVRGLEDMDP